MLYDENEDNADKIMIAVAKTNKDTEKIEKAFSSEKIRLTDALEDDKDQREKTRNIIVKTKGKYCILILSSNAKEIEKIFDRLT